MKVAEAITGRSSTRAYTNKPVDKQMVEKVLDIARWAPSGANMQPWRVVAVTGETRERIVSALVEAFRAGEEGRPDYSYYPDEWKDSYKWRRKKTGLALYSALGINKEDSDKRQEAWLDNYRFFGAPVGLLLFIDRSLNFGSFIDYGMFIQSVALAAYGLGLSTCPQASVGEYPDIVRDILGMDETQTLLCGMAMGYADLDHPVNQYRTTRVEVEGFMEWRS